MAIAPADPLRARGEEIHVLASFIRNSSATELVPDAFIRVMESGAWRHWRNELKREVQPADFKEFVETKYPSGIGTTLETLRKLITGHPQALNFYDKAMQREPYIHADVDNVNVRPTGNTEAYALRKLRKDAPEVHKQVLDGEISPHAGMIKAGFRKKTATVPLEVDAIVRLIQRRFSHNEIQMILNLLNEATQ